MKYILLILLLVSGSAIAQPPRLQSFGVTRAIDTNWSIGNMRIDGAIRLPLYPNSSTNVGLSTDAKGKLVLRTFSGGGGSTDTTSLSNRINLKLNISDTTGKWQYNLGFLPYTPTQVNNLVNARVLYTDTAAMLSHYQLKGDSLRYATRYYVDTVKANIRGQISAIPTTDSTKFSTVYRNDTGNANSRAYTAALSALAVKYTDTANMLAPYQLKGDSSRYATRYYVDTAKTNIRTQIAAIPTSADSAIFSSVYRNDTGNRNLRNQIAAIPATDSTLFSTVWRNDTGNRNIRAQIAALPATDSSIFSSVYRNDTGNRNLRNQIAALPLTDSTVFQTKYRSDTNRTNVYTYVNTKAPLASPTFTGTPIAPTPAAGTNTGAIATASFVTTALVAYTTQTVTATSYTTSVTVTSTTASPMSTVYYTITAQAGALLFAAPTGSWADGQILLVRIKDNGTARALTYNAAFRAGTTVALPTTTTISKTLYMEFIYNSADTKYDLLGIADGF